MQSLQESIKFTKACANCRDKKVKCNGTLPCAHCQRQHKSCWYPPSRRGKRDRNGSMVQHDFAQFHSGQGLNAEVQTPASQLPETECLLTPSHASPGASDRHGGEYAPDSASNDNPTSRMIATEISGQPGNLVSSDYTHQAHPTRVDFPSPVQVFQADRFSILSPAAPSIQEDSQVNPVPVADGEEGVIPLPKVNWEHHGPWSWASVCSQPGVKWVCAKLRSDEFLDTANGLTKTWSKRLKMKRFHQFETKALEPDAALAWKYVKAYFELSYDAVFGVIHRPIFETRLRAHQNAFGAAQREDPSWYALRNIVYAIGCRSMLATESSMSFMEADKQAGRYFQNALSVFSEIIFGHSGFTAVQAVTLMTFYAEGLGSPALEYPLCTNAVQLAQAKGLHRAPAKSWDLSNSDALNRSWLWWAIYCLEKQIAFRSGRPSIIDDENISTPIPTSASPGSMIDVEVLTLIIRHAQISSQISRRIMSVMAFRQPAAHAMTTAHDIHQKLKDLLESVPESLRIDSSTLSNGPLSPRRVQSVYLHFAIHGSIMATHVIFFYPWISIRFGTESDQKYHSHVLRASNTIAASARQIILALRSLTTDIAIPAWAAFYYPMYAHINIFIYLLRFPSVTSVMGDLALLDICAGHFGHVEHVTGSEISFHFPRESASLCSKFVKANKGAVKEDITLPSTPQPGTTATETLQLASKDNMNDANNGSMLHLTDLVRDNIQRESAHAKTLFQIQTDPFDVIDLDMESWNMFSSVDITDDLVTTFGDFVES